MLHGKSKIKKSKERARDMPLNSNNQEKYQKKQTQKE